MATSIKTIRRKMQVVLVQGFKCSTCGTETVTHDGSTPTVCLDCGASTLTQAWKNIVKDTTEVEVLTFP